MPNLLILVQARMGSARFPGKMLAPILGQPLILWLLSRLSRIQTPHTLVVACPNDALNDEMATLIRRHGYCCELWDGPQEDVLGRFAWVAEQYQAEEVVRICGDTPLVCPAVVDGLIAYHRAQRPHPELTGIAQEWGDGLDCEIMRMDALMDAHRKATLLSEREHVTSYMYTHRTHNPKNLDGFCIADYPCPFDLSWLRLSVDTEQDLHLVEDVLRYCLDARPDFDWRDIRHAVLRLSGAEKTMRARAINPAYVAQVAQEHGQTTSWETLRYGPH